MYFIDAITSDALEHQADVYVVLSQKVLALYGDSMQVLKKLVGKTTVVKDVRYGKAERNLIDVRMAANLL